MENCLYCQSSLPDRALFCPSCAKQVRCKQCRDFLESNARACVTCGFVVEESIIYSTGATEEGAEIRSPQQPINTLELRRSQKGSMVRVNFTDYAVSKSTEVLRRVIGIELPFAAAPTEQPSQGQLPLLLAGENGEPQAEKQIIDVTQSTTPNGKDLDGDERVDLAQLKQIFYRDGDKLVLDDTNLKASSQLDAGKRLTYLFLYAHALQGNPKVARDDINAVLKDVGLLDPNVINWISNSPDLAMDEETGTCLIRLRGTARAEAKRILTQMRDSNVQGAWTIKQRARPKGKKAAGEPSATDKPKRNSGTQKKSSIVASWIESWNKLSLPVDGHAICNDAETSVLTKGLLGLWAIRKATNDGAKVVSGANLTAFCNEAFVVSLSRRGLTKALESKPAQGKVIRRQEGYEITPTGISDIDSLLGKSKKENVTPPKAKAAGKL
jgi:hypothetical protein